MTVNVPTPLFGKVRAQSLVDVVAERIEAAIVSGELAPGSHLSEQALAASLGVSRGPLREAIGRLEGRKPTISACVWRRCHWQTLVKSCKSVKHWKAWPVRLPLPI